LLILLKLFVFYFKVFWKQIQTWRCS